MSSIWKIKRKRESKRPRKREKKGKKEEKKYRTKEDINNMFSYKMEISFTLSPTIFFPVS